MAIVTGGLGILGRGFCRGLAEFGADVAVVDLDGQACSLFAEELSENRRHRTVGVGCDVATPESVQRDGDVGSRASRRRTRPAQQCRLQVG